MLDLRHAVLFATLTAYVFPCGAGAQFASLAELEVQIDAGRVLGVLEDGVRSFKGIPYAAPPVGPFRWRPPQPVDPWPFPLQADSYGPKCIQPRYPASWNRGQGEDCLFLNVWTGAEEEPTRRPVIVWIHGGGFNLSSSSSAVYDGSSLARRGAVVVTFNYRLGPLGFLAHPELSAESDRGSSGNYGILDQIAVLQWVQRNIGAFGGDPERVTIGGESAGAFSIAALLTSPLAQGLFHRAIAQSGGGFLDEMIQLRGETSETPSAEAVGGAVCEAAGASSIDDLRKLAPELIVDALSHLPANQDFEPEPIIDGWVVPIGIRAALESGEFNKVAILLGSNADEGTIFTSGETFPETLEAYEALIDSGYGALAENYSKAYPVHAAEEIANIRAHAYRDSTFSLTARSWARLMAQNGATAYLYFFRRAPPNLMGDAYGAHHGAELSYAFDNIQQLMMGFRVTPTDQILADAMSRYWVSFAATGRPEAQGHPVWEPYHREGEPFLELGDTIKPGQHLLKEQVDFWERMLARDR